MGSSTPLQMYMPYLYPTRRKSTVDKLWRMAPLLGSHHVLVLQLLVVG